MNRAEEGTVKIARFDRQGRVNWGIVEGDELFALVGDLFNDFRRGKKMCQLSGVRLLAPVQPSIIIGVAMNYRDFALAMGRPIPEEPMVFFKPTSSVIGPGQTIEYPSLSRDVRHEGELCAVIKREAKAVTEAEATDYILGYTCGDDIVAMDLAQKDGWPTRAKSFPTFCPLGPFLVTDIDTTNLSIKAWVNDRLVQAGNTSHMIFGIGRIISYISQFMILRRGDVIMTGTPAGGAFTARHGDIVRIEIEGVGTLENKVVAP